MAKKCTHSLVEREMACADGYCPICLTRLNDKCVKMRRKLETKIKVLQIHANDGTYLKRLARQITNVLEDNSRLKAKLSGHRVRDKL